MESKFCQYCGKHITTNSSQADRVPLPEVPQPAKTDSNTPIVQNKGRVWMWITAILTVAMIVSVGWNIHFNGEVSELRTQTEELQTQTEKLTVHNDELEAENKELKDKADQLTKNIDKLDKDNTSLKKENKNLRAFEKQISDFAKNFGTTYKKQSNFRSYSNAIIVRAGETVSLAIKYTGDRTTLFYSLSNNNCKAEWGNRSGNMYPIKITGKKAGTAILSLSYGNNNNSTFRVLVIVV